MGMLRGLRARLGEVSAAVDSSKNDKSSKDSSKSQKQDGDGVEIEEDVGVA